MVSGTEQEVMHIRVQFQFWSSKGKSLGSSALGELQTPLFNPITHVSDRDFSANFSFETC